MRPNAIRNPLPLGMGGSNSDDFIGLLNHTFLAKSRKIFGGVKWLFA